MSATFSRTLRSLDADRPRRRLATFLVAVLLTGWMAWFVLGQVTVCEVTDKARLEVHTAAHAVAAPVGGQVVKTLLTLGREVREGDELIVLDAEAERRTLTEKRARIDALGGRLRALRQEIQAEQDAMAVQRTARTAAIAESRAQLAEAEARAAAAEREAQTSTRLLAQGAISEEQWRRDRTEAEARRATVKALGFATSRLEQDRAVQEGERKVRLAKLEREAVELDGDRAIEEAASRRLDHDIALRTIRAPVSGRIGEAADIRAGAVIKPAERLGAVVPAGPPRAVALFPPGAVGRLRPGQPARLRLEGFPWTQYGVVSATVADVGNETANGLIRVELTLDPDPASAIPLQHGLPGSVEVEVERVAPVVLVLRAAGQWLRVRRAADSTGGARGEP